MRIVESVQELREVRWNENHWLTWGLVPTMGALHAGHLSLVRRARAENDRVGVSIFVNPIQFNQRTDLEKSPRQLAHDCALLDAEGSRALIQTSFSTGIKVVYFRFYKNNW